MPAPYEPEPIRLPLPEFSIEACLERLPAKFYPTSETDFAADIDLGEWVEKLMAVNYTTNQLGYLKGLERTPITVASLPTPGQFLDKVFWSDEADWLRDIYGVAVADAYEALTQDPKLAELGDTEFALSGSLRAGKNDTLQGKGIHTDGTLFTASAWFEGTPTWVANASPILEEPSREEYLSQSMDMAANLAALSTAFSAFLADTVASHDVLPRGCFNLMTGETYHQQPPIPVEEPRFGIVMFAHPYERK